MLRLYKAILLELTRERSYNGILIFRAINRMFILVGETSQSIDFAALSLFHMMMSDYSFSILLTVLQGRAPHNSTKHLGKVTSRAESAVLANIKYALIS